MVTVFSVLFSVRSLALFTNIVVGGVPHYRNFSLFLTSVVAKIMTLFALGMKRMLRQPVKPVPLIRHETMLNALVVTTIGLTVSLLSLLARPIVPVVLMTISTVKGMKMMFSLTSVLPKKGSVSRFDRVLGRSVVVVRFVSVFMVRLTFTCIWFDSFVRRRPAIPVQLLVNLTVVNVVAISSMT